MKIDKTVRVELTSLDIEEAVRNHIAAQVPGISEMKLVVYDDEKTPEDDIKDRIIASAEITLVDGPIAIIKRDPVKNDKPLYEGRGF